MSNAESTVPYIERLLEHLDEAALACARDREGFTLSAENLELARATPRPTPPLTDRVVRTTHAVPATADAPELMLNVHRPRDLAGPLPCIYSIHGGGYVMGSPKADDVMFDRVCPELGCVGISVDYRLSPEVPFPGPLNDCHRGLRWVFENAAALGVNQDWIGVQGSSAGGGLAAGLALEVRDGNEVEIAFLFLRAPMLDDRQITVSSRATGAPVWNPGSNRFGWASYLGSLSGADDVPPYAAPARATDLSGLPPTLISVGDVDGFLDEDMVFARALTAAGVPTELHVVAGVPHGLDMWTADSAAGARMRAVLINWLEVQFQALRDRTARSS